MDSRETAQQPPPDSIDRWNDRQRQYWNSVAPKYDDLYADPWAEKENEYIGKQLRWLGNSSINSVLDLGCGTGLGAAICKEVAPQVEYVGMDISERMFAVASKAHPEFGFFAGDMADLSQLEDNSFDAVISLFSSFSHCMQPEAVLSEIQRVARPGARVMIAAMNGRSLDRVVFREMSDYDSIRMDIADEQSAPARLYTRKAYRRLFQEAGFRNVEVSGLALFANLWEWAPLWPIDCTLSALFPGLCDTLLAQGTCPEPAAAVNPSPGSS